MPTGDDEARQFGLSREMFEAAVEAIAHLRDAARIIVFLPRRGNVRLVGDLDAFRQEFSSRAKGAAIDLEQAKKAQDEVRYLITAIARMANSEQIVNFLGQIVYDEELQGADQAVKDEFRELQQAKLDMIRRKVMTDLISQRATRMATSLGPCLEELDYELVAERQDTVRGRRVKGPFLRLRLRYTEAASEFPYFDVAFGPFPQQDRVPATCLEFECDLSDLDLLQVRLNEAKQRLLDKQEDETEAM